MKKEEVDATEKKTLLGEKTMKNGI